MPVRDGHDVESRGGYYLSSKSVPRCQLATVAVLSAGQPGEDSFFLCDLHVLYGGGIAWGYGKSEPVLA